MKQTTSRPLLAFLLAFIGVIFFSSKAVLVKIAYEYNVDALSLLMLRLLFALPVYVGVLVGLGGGQKLKAVAKIDYFRIIGLGILGYYLASLLDFAGLEHISASLERLILFVYPTMVLLISSIFFGKKASNEQKIAVVITYFGVMLAFYKNTATTGNNMLLGSALVFASALSYAFYLVGCGNLIPRLGTKLFTSLAMIVSSIAAIIHFSVVEGFAIFSFQSEVYMIAIVMAIVCTVIPSFLIAEAIKQIGASNVAIVGSFGPISTIVLAAIFIGERITVFQMLGTVIVISGVMLLAVNRKPKEEKTSS